MESVRFRIQGEDGFSGTMEKFAYALGSMQSKANKAGKGMAMAGGLMTKGITVPLAGIATAATKLGADFEESMSSVKAVTDGTGKEMDQLQGQAKHLGKTTRFSATQAAEGMTYLGRSGYDTNQIMEAMPDVLNLAAAGNLDMAKSADIASNVMKGFNKKADDTGHISDVLAKSAASSNTSVEQMGKYYCPVAEKSAA